MLMTTVKSGGTLAGLTKIDEVLLQDHYFLEHGDLCGFLGEYNPRGNLPFSKYIQKGLNSLIWNFKKPVDKLGEPSGKYKARAINEISEMFLDAGENFNAWLKQATLVPIPPSKSKDDPLYDNRMLQVLQKLNMDDSLDIRELILQRQSTSASHLIADRPSPAAIRQNYYINEREARELRGSIGLFDDVVTTGAHFKAAKSLLAERFGEVPTYGIFVARRVPRSLNVEDLDF